MAMDLGDFGGFTGAYRDCVTFATPLGNGYRWYLPWLMRFAAPDSWSPFGAGGIHAYAYCAADPINRSDRSGHMWNGVMSMASEIAERSTREAVEEAAASLASQAAQRAAQAATENTPSTSGATIGSSVEGMSIAARRSRGVGQLNLPPNAFVLPDTVVARVPEPSEVDALMVQHRATAETIERGANAVRQRWRALMRESHWETAAQGRADPRVSQLSRPVVGSLGGDADHLLSNLMGLDQQLGRHLGQFEHTRDEIRRLQERIGRVSVLAWHIYSTLRQQVDTTRGSVFDFNTNVNPN